MTDEQLAYLDNLFANIHKTSAGSCPLRHSEWVALRSRFDAAERVCSAVYAEEWALASDDQTLYHQHSSYYKLVQEALAAWRRAAGKEGT